MSSAQSAEDVAKDGPVECYRKGYEEGYEAGKRVADISLYAKGYQDAFAEVTSRIEALFVVWANEPIPARIDGDVSDAAL